MEGTDETETFIWGKDALIHIAQSREVRKNRGKPEPNAKAKLKAHVNPTWAHDYLSTYRE